jgi:hypothetical protein
MTRTKLYTVVLDYQGGTYIAQVAADSPAAALPRWLTRLKDDDLAQWGTTRVELSNILRTEDVVPIDGCVNVWCISGSGKNGLVLINLIATNDSDAEKDG